MFTQCMRSHDVPIFSGSTSEGAFMLTPNDGGKIAPRRGHHDRMQVSRARWGELTLVRHVVARSRLTTVGTATAHDAESMSLPGAR